MTRAFLLVVLFIPSLVFSQQVSIESQPAWVAPITYPSELADSLDTGGYSYLLLEKQFNESIKQSFFRRALKIVTEKGLETASTLSVNFDPSYQRMAIVGIKIIRDGKLIDKTRNTKIETLRREENMERMLYDKSLDAVINVTDTQVGDIIEYAYIIKGDNPLLKDRISRTFYFNYADPVGHLYTSLICPSNRTLEFKKFNNARDPGTRTEKNNTVYYWSLSNVPALLSEDHTPSWYDAYDNIEISEYRTWEDVGKWALPLYALPKSSTSIDKKIEDIRKAFGSTDDQIRACIEFVQDEIRYLGFEGGVRGYKPNPPQRVFEQRFGDCKDKSLLLTYMLRKLGVESHPALVHTSMGKVLTEGLPSPLRFDHCIVRMNLRDSVYWIDPTMTLQRGKLKSRASADYSHALVIDDGVSTLTPMLPSNQISSTSVREDFYIGGVGKDALLTVKTIYRGSDADGIRNYWKSMSANEIKKNYTDFYANDYPDIKAAKNVEFTDDVKENVLTMVEQYTIPNFWIFDSEKNRYKGDFYARVIAGYLAKPSSKTRKMPLRINHPVFVDQTITVHLPGEWSIEEENEKISSPAFMYTGLTSYSNSELTLDHSYRSLRGDVAPEDARYHIQQIDDALNDLSYQLTWAGETTQSTSSGHAGSPFIIVAIAAAIGCFFLCKKLDKYDPHSHDYQVGYQTVGGWILLPAFGLFLTPITVTFELFGDGYFDRTWWNALTDTSYASYNPSHGALVLTSLIYNIFLIGGSVFLLILMIKRRTSLPVLFIGFIAIRIGFSIISEVWLSSVMSSTPFTSYKPYLLIFVGAIWIAYFSLSDRVKGTFRERREASF
jgi:transglutaminase-like putative cysteine protease